MSEGVHDGDDGGAGLGAGKLGRRGAAHAQHDVGIAGERACGVGAIARAGGGVIGVGNSRTPAPAPD